MLWFILGITTVIIFIGYMILDGYYTVGEIFGLGFMSLLAAVLCALLLTATSVVIADSCADKTYSVVEDIDIYALQDNLTTEGRFFLGSGHVDGELKYFYVEESEFGYKVNSIDADKCYIKYTSDRCHLEKQTYTFDNSFVQFIAIPMSDRYVFYIPEGSIINNYSVDLK